MKLRFKSKRLQALNKRVHHKIRTSEGLSEKPVTVNETREASASDLAAANNTSSASSDNFGLKVTNLSRPIPSDVKVTKTGTEINVQNPDVEMEFPNGKSKYAN